MRRLRRMTVTLLVTLLALSALTRIVSAGLAILPEEEERQKDAPSLLCPPSEEVALLLEQIARRDAVLQDRETALAEREQDAIVARQEVSASLARLEEAETRLEARMQMSRTASEGDIARLTSVYEGMKPKDAAILFAAMEPGFASGFLGRMRPDAAAAIFGNLPPDSAYALSVHMAGRNANAATE